MLTSQLEHLAAYTASIDTQEHFYNMSKTIDYYHFLTSPWSYLAIGRFNALKARSGVTVNYLPIDAPSTFAETGGLPPAKRHPSRQRFRMDELKRWSARLASRMVHACNEQGEMDKAATLSDALLLAVWNEEKNVADEDTLVTIAKSCSIDGDALLEQAKSDAIGKVYEDCTAGAHQRDVFGSPTYILGDELFWGQDRISFLEKAIG